MKKLLLSISFMIPSIVFANKILPTLEPSVYGIWATEDKRAKVQIDACKHNTQQICGTIVWLQEPIDPETKQEKTDKHNKNSSLRERKLIGLENLTSFIQSKADSNLYEQGKIYNPKDGKDYKAHLKLLNKNTLKVTGYILLPLLGKTQTWERTTLE